MSVNAQYSVAAANSIPIKIAGYQRRKMFAAFRAATGIADTDTVLDVGVTSDQTYEHSNYMVAWLPNKQRITAAGIDDASFLETVYPGVRFVPADGRKLPFADGEFDYVHSSAVLEHVGSTEKQAMFLSEIWRVARKGVFVTTPNRWFPVEFHTVLPVLHWLPNRLYRKILTAIGQPFFASEDNLNLLGEGDFLALAKQAGMNAPKIDSVKLAGWPTNFMLSAHKAA